MQVISNESIGRLQGPTTVTPAIGWLGLPQYVDLCRYRQGAGTPSTGTHRRGHSLPEAGARSVPASKTETVEYLFSTAAPDNDNNARGSA
jgi:hypothetical protein